MTMVMMVTMVMMTMMIDECADDDDDNIHDWALFTGLVLNPSLVS